MSDSSLAHNFVRGITISCIRRNATYADYLVRIGELYLGLAITEEEFNELKLKQLLGVNPCPD